MSDKTRLELPKHIALYLSHNDHATTYGTVKAECEFRDLDADDWVSEEQRQKAIHTNDMWSCQWYPDNPVGFNLLCAADLDALLEALSGIAAMERKES